MPAPDPAAGTVALAAPTSAPAITWSIVMPVFDTGALLLDSVRSVLAQTFFDGARSVAWELLIVDDGSTDPATLAALAEARALAPQVTVLKNQRSRGVAGARNTGVFAARGTWIGFLDSDDLWYPGFLQAQHDAFEAKPEARWRAAHFHVGDEAAHTSAPPLAQRSPCLYRVIEEDYLAGRISMLERPVDVQLRCGCMQIMTVQIHRDLLRSVNGFDEDLRSAEDYDLWLRLAVSQTLYIAPLDAGIYRVRSGSLTKAGNPKYHQEDRMLRTARADVRFAAHRPQIDTRLRMVYSTFCHHYRGRRDFATAARHAVRLIRLAPFSVDGWRHLVASGLRR